MNADILTERFGTNRVVIKCKEFEETVQATNKLQEIGFKCTDNSKIIASGEKVHAWGYGDRYWKHPYITFGEIHYYHSSFDFVSGDYKEIITFHEFMELFEETNEDNIEITDDDFANYFI